MGKGLESQANIERATTATIRKQSRYIQPGTRKGVEQHVLAAVAPSIKMVKIWRK